MKAFLKKHPEAILIASAIALLALIIAYYTWGIGYIVSEVNRGLKFSAPETKVGFDLQGAAKLNLRGLLNQPAQ